MGCCGTSLYSVRCGPVAGIGGSTRSPRWRITGRPSRLVGVGAAGRIGTRTSLKFSTFISSGSFTDWREIADARAKAYVARYSNFGGGAQPAGFNTKQFNSNFVFRWEYLPGSVLFLVWQQGRVDGRNPGTFDGTRDLRDLFQTHPDNTLLLKVSYWFNP